ncbi:MAG: sigma-70 family RNA polymerase sigma factor [Planctomycetes bacterium]|nr:sigma-70 family RNA polymerase sigma factor [Planctomycetota bacterium]MCB9905152.1 sigma-70 family RNA polymerase sigma factor [Planctomycetota bacterium]
MEADEHASASELRELTPLELARRARAGSRPCFAALVERHEAPLYRFLLARVGDRCEAEDLCQDAFLRAWERLDRYDERWQFSTWLYTIALRMAVSRGRKLRPELNTERVASERGGPDPAAQCQAAEERDSLWALAKEHCSEDQRTALWLRYGEDVSYEELGRILGRPVATVRVQLFRARRLLERRLLEREAERERPRAVSGATEASLPSFDLRTLSPRAPSMGSPANGVLR